MQVTGLRGRLLPVVLAAALIFAAVMAAAAPASASATLPSRTVGDRVLNMAETRAGAPYSFGAAGPSYFDCSGMIVYAAGRLGISVPHSTYGMLAGTAHLYRISLSQVRRGDLLFFGSGHVELATRWYHVSFGAHHSGTRAGWRHWSGWYQPTMAMRFRLRGDAPRWTATGARTTGRLIFERVRRAGYGPAAAFLGIAAVKPLGGRSFSMNSTLSTVSPSAGFIQVRMASSRSTHSPLISPSYTKRATTRVTGRLFFASV